MLNLPESEIFIDDRNQEWESLDEIAEALNEAIELKKPDTIAYLNEVFDAYVEWTFEKTHGLIATLRVFL